VEEITLLAAIVRLLSRHRTLLRSHDALDVVVVGGPRLQQLMLNIIVNFSNYNK
jgi:hypothetical protein